MTPTASPSHRYLALPIGGLALALVFGHPDGQNGGDAEDEFRTWAMLAAEGLAPGMTAAVGTATAAELADLDETIRPALEAACRDGREPWRGHDHPIRHRREHPEQWLPLVDYVRAVDQVATMNRSDRRLLGRAARARGAGRPAGRRRRPSRGGQQSGDSGSDSDGPGEAGQSDRGRS